MDVDWTVVVLADAVVWVLWSAAVGWWQAQHPWHHLQPGRLGRIRSWEADGRWYERRLGVRRWKRWLPEAGTWFGGLSKRHRPSPADGGWQRLAAECLRAERTHGWIVVIIPWFAVWNPAGLFAANVLFAVVANVPCWVVARCTRARVEALARGRGAQR